MTHIRTEEAISRKDAKSAKKAILRERIGREA